MINSRAKAKPMPPGIDLRLSGMFRARATYAGRTYRAEFETVQEAEAWLKRTRRELKAGTYAEQTLEKEAKPMPLLGPYAQHWVEVRNVKPSTRALYESLLPHLKPLARERLDAITVDAVEQWHRRLELPPTRKAHTYGLLRSILNTAYRRDLIPANPCRLEGAGSAKRKTKTTIPTPVQVHQMADAMPSEKYRMMLLLAAWCGVRFGELAELRPEDFRGDTVTISRAVTRVSGSMIVGDPKSDAGIRTVVIPHHIRAEVDAYLAAIKPGKLLFPARSSGGHMQPSTLYKVWYPVREAAGLPLLRWHDLRHFAGTTAAQTGATLAELQAFLGHSTVAASMRYQGVASGRMEAMAAGMSALAPVTPIRAKTKAR